MLPSFDDAWQQFVDEVGPDLVDEMGTQSPVSPIDGGTLAASHSYRDNGGVLEIVSTDNRGPIALYVIKGTRPHPIDPVRARFLHWFNYETGENVYATHVEHPGTAPNPYNIAAWEARREAVVRRFAELCGRDRVLVMLNPFRRI